MANKFYKKDGRVLVFQNGGLSEIHSGNKLLFNLCDFMEEPTYKNIGLFTGTGLLAGVITSFVLGMPRPIILLSAIIGLCIGFTVLLLIAVSLKDISSGNLLVKNYVSVSGSIEKGLSSTEEVFKFYDQEMSVLEMTRKVDYARELLEKSSVDLPIYEDLKNKKEKLDNELSKAEEQLNNLSDQIIKRHEDKEQAHKEKEILDFLNAA